MLVAAGIGITRRKNLSPTLRLVTLQVILALTAEVSGYFIALKTGTSTWFLNIYIPIDFAMMLAIWSSIRFKPQKLVFSGILLFTYIAVWTYQFATTRMDVFINMAYLFGCTSVVALFLYTIAVVIQSYPTNRERITLYLLCLSAIIFYCGQIPLFGLINILSQEYAAISRKAFQVNFVLEVIRYSLVIYILSSTASGLLKSKRAK